jgi:hypothetical protein
MDSDDATSYLQQARAAISQFASPASEWSDMASPVVVKSNRSSPPLPSEQEFVANDGGTSLMSDDSFDRVLLAALDAADEAQRGLGDESPLVPAFDLTPEQTGAHTLPGDSSGGDAHTGALVDDQPRALQQPPSDSSGQNISRDADNETKSNTDVSTQPQSPHLPTLPPAVLSSDVVVSQVTQVSDSDSGDSSIVFDLADAAYKRTPQTATKASRSEPNHDSIATDLAAPVQFPSAPQATHQVTSSHIARSPGHSAGSQSIWLNAHESPNSKMEELQVSQMQQSLTAREAADRSSHRYSPPSYHSSTSERPTLQNVRELAENVRHKAELLQHAIQQETIRLSPPTPVAPPVARTAPTARVQFRSPAASVSAVSVPMLHGAAQQMHLSTSLELRTHDRCIAERKFRQVHVLSEEELQQMRLRPSALPLVHRLLATLGSAPVYKPLSSARDRLGGPFAEDATKRASPLPRPIPSTTIPLRSQYLASDARAVSTPAYMPHVSVRPEHKASGTIPHTPQTAFRAQRGGTPSPLLDRAFKQIQESNALLARTRS